MTIGFDGSRAFGQGRTGTENYSYQLLKHLSLIDTENQYLIYTRKGQGTRDQGQKWPGNFKFVEIALPRLWTQVGLALRTFIDRVDVLFVPAHTLPLIRRQGLRSVITVHDLGAEFLPAFHQLKQVLYLNLMTHYQLKTATKIIAVSKATKEDIQDRVGVSSEKIEVVYEGVDKNVFKKLSIDIENHILHQYKLTKNKYFFFIGTIQPRKNLDRLIRAFAEFLNDGGDKTASYELVLAGSKGWKSEGIYLLPKELGIEGRVRFIGRVTDEELNGLYGGAAALVYPSLFEGFGLPILEAFSAGCPVITSNLSSMPEIAGNAAVLVDPYNIVGISKAMQELASNDTLRLSLIKKGRLRSEEFSWKYCAVKTLKVLNSVIKK